MREKCIGPRCSSRAVQRHHVIYAQHLRAAGARVDDDRILVPICVRCHERHHAGVARLPLWVLPDSVFVAAVEILGTAAHGYLARYYSGGDQRHDALLREAA